MTSIDPSGPAAQRPADLPHDVLIVEDDPLIALDLSETIRSFGVASVRTARRVDLALTLIAEHAPEFALLDVGLNREKSFAIGEQLAKLRIPFAFITGYAGEASLPAELLRRPVLAKPYSKDALLAVLSNWRGESER